MRTLLVSLGTSPAIVPEASLFPDGEFAAVHVLTTASVKETDLEFIAAWMACCAPKVAFSMTRVADFTDFRSEWDHFHFEEVLYRWWLEKCPEDERPHVCLSGGFKTMSAAMQKAAAVLGAAEVFHVLCDLPQAQQPKTAEDIEMARVGGHLHWIRLGLEGGWPQLRGATAEEYPLSEREQQGCARSVAAPDTAFRDRVGEMVARSHNIAGAWDRLGRLPFPVLATWPASALDWLSQPVDPVADREWVQSLPKVDLHCHLGGFATHGVLLGEVRAAAEDPFLLPPPGEVALPAGWPEPEATIGLDDYMKLGDANGSKLLKDSGCLRRQCEVLYQHFLEHTVCYAEVRCSPNNYTRPDRSAWDVLGELRASFERCMEQSPGCQINLIIIATRKDGGDRSDISRHLALAITAAQHWKSGCRVVGVDLAGFERPETRAALFATDFEPVHRVGLAVTVHAGENDDAEGIWQAVFKLNARRLGHALHLVDAPDLLRSVADRGIAVELCPYANFQIKGFLPMPGKGRYPLTHYLNQGLTVTLNTDNIGISAASLTDNLLLAAKLCPDLTRQDILQLVSHSTQAAFLPPQAREALRRHIQDRLRPETE